MALFILSLVVAAAGSLAMSRLTMRKAFRVDRPMTRLELDEARRLTDNDVCYSCGGPIRRAREFKHRFDECDTCRSC